MATDSDPRSAGDEPSAAPTDTEPTPYDWWAGRDTDAHADAWRLAGRTATPNFHARTVSFERVAG